jgi:electron transfer flavoprotein beta subunit
LKIVACIKQVPDSAAKVVAEDGKVSWGDAPLVINPWDEFAVEAALQQKEAHGGEVIAISMGNENSKEALKHALAMGCDSAILIADPALKGTDTGGTARVLATAIQKVGGVELAFFGRQAIDGDAGITPAQTARVLGWPMLSLASVIKVEGGKARVERSIEEGARPSAQTCPLCSAWSKTLVSRATPRSWASARPRAPKSRSGPWPIWASKRLQKLLNGPL